MKRKVQILTEVTDWDFPNHTYIIDPSSKRLIAYIKKGTDEVIKLSGKSGKGFSFTRSHRKFTTKWRYLSI